MTTRLARVVIDAVDVEGLARFWSAALGWPLLEDVPPSGQRVVRSPGEPAFDVTIVRTTRPKQGKNRLHLDLGAPTGTNRGDLLQELKDGGATPVDIGQGDVAWDVLADPEGNELCVAASSGPTVGRLAAICLDAADTSRQLAFWAAATGWVLEAEGDWGGALRHPSGSGPALIMGPPVAAKTGRNRNRLHLDVAPSPGGDPEAEVDRLIGLGAARGTRVAESWAHDEGQVVLADPEGNELCVLRPR
jgi:hypothetical protein